MGIGIALVLLDSTLFVIDWFKLSRCRQLIHGICTITHKKMSMSENCKDGVSKSNDDGVCEVNDMLNGTSMVDKDNGASINISVCANCGKEDAKNVCNKCNQVKYCNAVCKKKHRHKHKKECEKCIRLAAERAAQLNDEQLFDQSPPAEDCPICFQQLPTLDAGWRYMACCGKVIVDVHMLLYMITKAMKLIIKSVLSAELHILLLMKS